MQDLALGGEVIGLDGTEQEGDAAAMEESALSRAGENDGNVLVETEDNSPAACAAGTCGTPGLETRIHARTAFLRVVRTRSGGARRLASPGSEPEEEGDKGTWGAVGLTADWRASRKGMPLRYRPILNPGLNHNPRTLKKTQPARQTCVVGPTMARSARGDLPVR